MTLVLRTGFSVGRIYPVGSDRPATWRREALDDLFVACCLAFVVVFLLLAVLAAVMRLITTLLPERRTPLDPAVVAAISTAVASVLPGARVTKIEENESA